MEEEWTGWTHEEQWKRFVERSEQVSRRFVAGSTPSVALDPLGDLGFYR